MMEFFESQKGKRKLALGGHMYLCERTKNGVTYWRCEFFRYCKSRMATNEDDSILRGPAEHSHPPEPGRVEVAIAKSKLRNRALSSDERTSNIVMSETQSLSLAAAGALPKRTSLQRTIQRKRHYPEGDGLLEEQRKTTRGEDFLLEEDDESGFYLFASEKNLDLLNNSDNWYCDGTFDVAPTGSQLYTIHALINECRVVPLVYAVMQQKTEELYKRIFRILKDKRPGISPENVTIDFEMAAYNALSALFPMAQILGCLFHFGQCSYRKIQSLSLQQWYVEDPEHALIIKCFQALAFVPPEQVVQRYKELLETLRTEQKQHLQEYIQYFEATWIGLQHGRTRRCHRRPMFPIRCWNVYHRVKNDLPRTNNSIEGWHNAFSKRVSITHPTLRRLVKKIIQEQGANEIFIEQLNAGINGLPPKRKRYAIINKRLKTIVEGYNSTDDSIASYLRSIAHNL